MEIASFLVSLAAFSVSMITAWFTLLRRGKLKMTQPTTIFFGPDGPEGTPKIYLRSLLFSTGKRGVMIESVHLKVSRHETVQNFNIWVYGESSLSRGSGLFVGEDGISTNHHFLLPKDGSSFAFSEGVYELELFAKTLGKTRSERIWSEKLALTQTSAQGLLSKGVGVFFDWGPDSQKYLQHVDVKLFQQSTKNN